MTEEHRPLHFFTILILILVVVIAGFFGVYTGSHIWVSATGSSVSYTITTSGLNTSTADEPVTLYFPLPYVKNAPALSSEKYHQSFEGWVSITADTEYGNMLAFTATTFPLKDIQATFRQDRINYAEMFFSHRIPKTFGQLNLLPKVSVPHSPYTIYADDTHTTYSARPDTNSTLIYLPATINSSDPIEIHVTYQVFTPQNLKKLLAGRITRETVWINERIPPGNISGFIPVSQLIESGQQPHEYFPIKMDPPKGSSMNDFVLLHDGTCVPGYTTHYDYMVGTNTTEFRVALTWDNPKYRMNLNLIAPDGYILGPYTDQYDNIQNGIIPLTITSPASLEGEWGIEVSSEEPPGRHQPYQIHVREY